ncbi:MAG: Na+/H+ antiporter NhaC family protein [Rubrobacteraceae bacterium]
MKSIVSVGKSITSNRFWPTIVVGLICAAVLYVVIATSSQTAVAQQGPQGADQITFKPPRAVPVGVPFSQEVKATAELVEKPLTLTVAGEDYTLQPDDFSSAKAGTTEAQSVVNYTAEISDITVPEVGSFTMALSQDGDEIAEAEATAIWGFLTLLPPLLAITIALISRQVIPSLVLGIYIGAVMIYGLTPSALWFGLLDTIEIYIAQAIVPPDGDTGHISIILFTLLMGGLIGIVYRNGGAFGIADRISVLASNRRRGQISTSGLGFAIFFSTYANSLVIGNTMRPVTDRLKISREKLAYIVDSTAAPLAAIAVISTWIGFELGLIESSVSGIGFDEGAYAIFLNSIPYNFYPIWTLIFVIAVGATGRDYGPMLKAEQRASQEGKVLRDNADVDANADEDGGELQMKEDAPRRAFNAVIPIGVLVGTVAVGLYVTGTGETLRDIIGSAETGKTLLWAGLLGVLAAVILSVGQRILSLKETMDAWYGGLKSVLFVMIILTLAWALGAVAADLKTANYLVSILGDALSPAFLPAILFILAAAVSFAVGTSWGTMAILMPLAVPLVWTVLQNNDMANPDNYYIMYATIGTVLAGSVWGDHCSPISDTTIISSVAAGSDHIDHVRTQIPYALTVGFAALLLGLIPAGFGVSPWITLPIGAVVLVGVLFIFGTKVEDTSGEEDQESEVQEEETAAETTS